MMRSIRGRVSASSSLSIASLVVYLIAGSAPGTTIHVPADYPTIQEGIRASANGDTVLVAPASITNTSTSWTGASS